MPRSPVADPTAKVALVLGGGNALGAYLAGAYECLHLRVFRPDWIVGGSVGAVTGAILAGNPPEQRVDRLREFWRQAMIHTSGSPTRDVKFRQIYNGVHSAWATAAGRPGLFRRR